jgi:CPA2 family monovalent cation:H+ antiporter-2
MLDTERGRFAVGWLVVEDLVTILTLVLLPTVAAMANGDGGIPPGRLAFQLLVTLVKVAIFVTVMLLVGRRVIPWLMHYTAHTGSRELFRLAVYALAIGVAFGAAKLFDVSFALGAFFAGVVMGESTLSQQATEEALPLRDAFAVLFFVSVGMLLNPSVLIDSLWPLLGALAIVLLGKSVAAFFIVRAFGHKPQVALVISASLAQIGEFSFILAGLGVALGVLTQEARDLVLAAAIISILLNPTAFVLLDRFRAKHGTVDAGADKTAREIPPTGLSGHIILVGYGRVGSVIGEALRKTGSPFLVIDTHNTALEALTASGIETIDGNAADHAVFAAAKPEAARCLFVAVPDAFEAGAIVEQARAANPGLPIVARAHSDTEAQHLTRLGATTTVIGETELALEMLRRAPMQASA